jgi:hypothetical protein
MRWQHDQIGWYRFFKEATAAYLKLAYNSVISLKGLKKIMYTLSSWKTLFQHCRLYRVKSNENIILPVCEDLYRGCGSPSQDTTPAFHLTYWVNIGRDSWRLLYLALCYGCFAFTSPDGLPKREHACLPVCMHFFFRNNSVNSGGIFIRGL